MFHQTWKSTPFVRSFITKEMEFDGQKCDRKVMMNFGKQVYTKAKVKANAKILVRVQADLFIEMPYERALDFIARRIKFLSDIANEYLKEIAQIKGHMTMTYAVMDPSRLQ
ncbi:hypothetical protein M3Y97_00333800 [Aphelenchoides bicaudatus]|nr:hypothetical protein M3Y97_00333800 [Aphelenchoides bicaudatus]